MISDIDGENRDATGSASAIPPQAPQASGGKAWHTPVVTLIDIRETSATSGP
jgi:hypothetical protein